jgi:molybdopterin-guanine dinucleotide biosynthesis protein
MMMDKIVVSGEASGVGKTTLVEKIITNICGKIVAIKAAVNNKVDQPIISSEKEKKLNPEKDTGKYLTSGADHAIYFKSNLAQLEDSVKRVHNLLGKSDYIIYEGNNILDFLNPDLIIFLKDNSVKRKLSARKAEKKAEIIIDRKEGLSLLESISFQQESITCYKAHLLAGILGLSVEHIGRILDDQEIKIKGCQLGLF